MHGGRRPHHRSVGGWRFLRYGERTSLGKVSLLCGRPFHSAQRGRGRDFGRGRKITYEVTKGVVHYEMRKGAIADLGEKTPLGELFLD